MSIIKQSFEENEKEILAALPKEFHEDFKKELKENDLEPKSLKLEITEGLLLEEEYIITDSLKELDKLGVQLSLDDFGTGYSSLSYLSMLNASVLKIDRQFIARMTQSSQDQQIVKMIIELL